MTNLIDGTLNGWPVSLMQERDYTQCAAYEQDTEIPLEVVNKCYDITDACDGLTPAKALKKAISMGFVQDK